MVHSPRWRPDGSHNLLTHHDKDATYRGCSEAAQVVFNVFKHLPTPPQLSLFDLDELTPKQSEDLDCFCTFLLFVLQCTLQDV